MATVFDNSIDKEQINGAFALAVDVRFDNLASGANQKVFDLNNGSGVDNIWLGQVGNSDDIEFVIVQGGVQYRVVAENAIVEGEYATFRVGVDREGNMRIAKNTDLLVEENKGLSAVPADVDRVNYQIGESSNSADSDLDGVVLNLKLANYADTVQLGAYSNDSPCAITGEATCLCEKLYPEGQVNPGQGGPAIIPTTDVEGDGEWSAVQSLGLIAIHSIVLPDGKVLSFGTNENGVQGAQFVYSLYDPETGIDKILPNTTPTDIFCSNMSIDPATGNVIIMGGDERGEGGTTNHGVNDVVIFDYRTETIRTAEQGEMQYARWYGTTVNLPDGDILHIGGRNDTGGSSFIPEVFNSDTGFRTLTGANMTDLGGAAYFPHVWVNSRGEVIVMESGGRDIFRLSVEGAGSYEKIGTFPYSSAGQQPSIMFDQDKIARVANDGGLWVTDISQPVPTSVKVAQLSSGRYDGGMTVLPDGAVAFTGGGATYNTLGTAKYAVEIWDPTTNSVTVQEDAALARLYHSSHVLLPDGTIFVGGGGAPGPLVNTNFEIFAPAYLYGADGSLADRPDILSVPTNVSAGSTFQMTVDDSSAISKVTVSKSGAMTHGRNADARFLSLDFTVVDANTIEVSTPNNFVMTPGAWMLFTVDSNGVPSKGEMLGVDMAQLVDTGNFSIEDLPLTVYGIDDDPINGAFEITVEARFDELDGRNWQRVFDFGNGPAQDNILLTQLADTNDMALDIWVGATQYRIVATDAIVEGVMAKWTVSVDASGFMRMWKDDVLIAQGQGAVPNDVDRSSNLVGKSNWASDDDLRGEVRFLETVNAGDQAEYIHLGLPTATLTAPTSVVEGDEGDTGQIIYTLQLSDKAQSIVTADVVITGAATGPAQVVIPSGSSSAQIILNYQGDNTYEVGESVTVALQNLTQARAPQALTATTRIENDDAQPPLAPLQVEYFAISNGASSLSQIDFNAQPISVQTVEEINFYAQTGSFYSGGRTDDFAARFTGNFETDTTGSYTFYLNSDDGSALFINGQQIINNDGLHAAQLRTQTITLDAGVHDIEVRYFERGGLATLDLEWAGPGFARSQMRFEAEPLPALTLIAPSDVQEGDVGEVGSMTFTITLDKPATTTVTADVAISGDATGPATVTIPAGANSATIVLSYQGDNTFEGDETVTVSLSNLVGATTSAASASAKILEDEVLVDTVVADENFSNGAAGWSDAKTDAAANGDSYLGGFGAQQVEKTFDLPAGTQRATIEFDFLEIDSWDGESFFITINGQEINLGSYRWTADEGVSGFNAGNGVTVQKAAAVDLDAIGNTGPRWSFNDNSHKFTLTIDNPAESLTLGFRSTLNQGLNDESFGVDNLKITASGLEQTPPVDPPKLTIGTPARQTEGDSGTDSFTFGVSLDKPASVDVVADVQLFGDVAGPAQITIPAGSVTGQIIVSYSSDTTPEVTEFVGVKLTNLQNAEAGATLMAVTGIIDDDGPLPNPQGLPVLALAGLFSPKEGDAGETPMAFNIGLDKPSAVDITADVTILGDANGPTTITIPAGTTSFAVPITLTADVLDEPNGLVYVSLTNVQNAITDSQPWDALRIIDEDDPVRDGQTAFEVEAEEHMVTNFRAETGEVDGTNNAFASLATGASFGVLEYNYKGATAVYNISLETFDESDGASVMEIIVNGQVITRQVLDQDLGDAGFSVANKVSVLAPRFTLQDGDVVQVRATSDGGDVARLDKLVFTPTSEPALPRLTLTAPADVQEGAAGATGTLVYTVSLDAPAFADITADITIQGGASGPTQLTIPAGQSSAQITLTFQDDDVDEADETIAVTLSNVQNASVITGQASATILDDDVTLGAFEVEAETIIQSGFGTETNSIAGTNGVVASLLDAGVGGSGVLSYTYTGADQSYDLSVVLFDESDGVAPIEIYLNGNLVVRQLLDQDLGDISYSAANKTTVDANGLALKSGDVIEVRGTFTGGEAVRIDKLSFSPSGGAPTAPVLTLNAPADVIEGAAGENGVLLFTATLNKPATESVTADLTIGGNVSGPASITIPAGQSSVQIPLTFIGDNVDEFNETVSITLSNVLGALAPVLSASAQILDDDLPAPGDVPQLTIGTPARDVEGAAGETGSFTFGVSLSKPTTVDVIADVELIGDVTGPATVTIPAGSVTGQIVVQYQGDNTPEASELVAVRLSNLQNANPGSTLMAVTGVINDDGAIPNPQDLPVLVLAGLFSPKEGDSGETPMAFNISLSKPSAVDVTADVTIIGDANGPTSITIPAGVTSFAVPITVSGDVLDEPNGLVYVSLTNVQNAVTDSQPWDALRIIDEDDPVRDGQTAFEVEAEEHMVTNFRAETGDVDGTNNAFASLAVGAGFGVLEYNYRGAASVYDVSVNTFDENDGVAQIEIIVNGQVVATQVLDQDLGDASFSAANAVSVTANSVTLRDGDLVEVRATSSGGDVARIDKLVFTPTGGQPEPLPVLTLAAQADVQEGAAGQTGTLVYTVTLDKAWTSDVTAEVAITGGATGPAQLTIPAGQTTAQITLTFQGDDVDEADETIAVTLSDLKSATAGGLLTASAQILDDDNAEPPFEAFSVEAETIIQSGFNVLNLPIAGTNGSFVQVSGTGVLAYTFNGPNAQLDLAVAAFDETDGAGTIQILINGQVVKSQVLDQQLGGNAYIAAENLISVDANDLVLRTGDLVQVRAVSDGGEFMRIDKLTFTPTAEQPTFPPELTLTAPADVQEGAAGETGSMLFTVTLDKPATQAVTADVAIAGGATGPATVTIPAGASSATIALSFQGDDVDENDEPISVTLSNLTGAIAAGSLSASAQILDDDGPAIEPLQLEQSQVSFYGGNVGNTVGLADVSDDGQSITIGGNVWASIQLDQTLTENTVISFDLEASDVGEILGFMFEDDNNYNSGALVKLGGSQNFSGFVNDFSGYQAGDGVQSYEIKIGDYFQGDFTSLVLVGDDDRDGSTNAAFSNILIYEEPITFGGSRYELGTKGLTWEQANAEAQAKGGKIVEIDSAEENAFIFNTFGDQGGTIWLGINDKAQEGLFVDSDGDSLGYTNWNAGEPNNFGASGEDYAEMYTSNGLWNDIFNDRGDNAVLVIEYDFTV